MQNPRKKIAFVLSGLIAGGAERNAVNTVLAMRSMGYAIDIILFEDHNEYKNEYTAFAKRIKVINLLSPKSGRYKTARRIRQFYSFYKLAKENQYELIIGGVEYYVFYFTVLLAKLLRRKSVLIVGIHLSEDIKNRKRFSKNVHKALFILSFLFTDRIICVSKGVAKDLREKFFVKNKKVHIVYNGVDLKYIGKKMRENPPLDQKLRLLPPKKKVIISLGRLVERKGFVHLIRSFTLLSTKRKDIVLVIIGKGKLKNLLQREVDKLQLEKRVFVIGFKKNPYIYLKKADLFVFPSLYEGFGNVIVEAMACGLPVIATDCQYGPREILSEKGSGHPTGDRVLFEKYGVLVPPFQPTQDPARAEEILGLAIDQLITNKKKLTYYKKMSCLRVNKFSVQKMVTGYKEVFDEVLPMDRYA